MSAAFDDPAKSLFDRLEIVDDAAAHGGPFHMALDEVLLGRLHALPVLRLYRWSVPSVSFGYFDPWAKVRTAFPDVELVRRWTGGGVVQHGRDLTYSLLVPRTHHFAKLAPMESYRLVHAMIAAALSRLGWETTTSAKAEGLPVANDGGACFVNPVRHDLLFEGTKIAGAAQRRTRAGLLHQGSVQGVAAFDQAYELDTLRRMLIESFCPAPCVRTLSQSERDAAQALVQTKYGTRSWLERF